MSRSDRYVKQLEFTRSTSEGMLKDFKKPEDWTHQVCPQANHALWFAGHMGVADNFFLSMLSPGSEIDTADMQKHFGMGSDPSNRPSDYPPVEDVLSFMRDRRTAFLDTIKGLGDADLDTTLPEGTPDMWSDKASVIETSIWHEGMHTGQLSIARRSLGHNPLMGAPAEEEATA